MLVLLFLLSTFSLVTLSPVAEPEPEAEPEPSQYYSLQRSVVGFYTPVYYQYQQGLQPGFTYRFGPPLPSHHLTDLAGDTFRNAFNNAFRQYISSGLLKTYEQTGDISGENLTASDLATTEEVETQDLVTIEEDHDNNHNESENEDARDTDILTPVIEISK